MLDPEITRFAEHARTHHDVMQQVAKLNRYADVTAYAHSLGFNFREEDLSDFMTGNARDISNSDFEKIVAARLLGGQSRIDFSEESIVRFSAVRLQVCTDY